MSTTGAAIHTRVSLDRNGDSQSPERQEADCRSLAQQLGWEVVEVYTDRDSAYSWKVRRPHYEQMMRDLRAGKADALVVWKLDRLTRQGLKRSENHLGRSGVRQYGAEGDDIQVGHP